MKAAYLLLVLAFFSGSVMAQTEGVAPKPVPAAQRPDAQQAKERAADPEVDAWARVLIERMAHQNEAIRSSAQEALLRLGKLAQTQLKAAAGGADEGRAKAAKELLARMEQQRRTPKGEGGFENRRPAESLENMFATAAKAANLTPEQEAKVKAVFEEQRVKTQELFAQVKDGVLTKEEVRAALQGMEKARHVELAGILDAAQVKVFMDAMQKARQGGEPRRRGDGDK